MKAKKTTPECSGVAKVQGVGAHAGTGWMETGGDDSIQH